MILWKVVTPKIPAYKNGYENLFRKSKAILTNLLEREMEAPQTQDYE